MVRKVVPKGSEWIRQVFADPFPIKIRTLSTDSAILIWILNSGALIVSDLKSVRALKSVATSG